MNEKIEKGSFVTLENPITNKDLHNKLFTALLLPGYGFKPRDNITLFISKKQEHQRRVFFGNHKNIDFADRILIGKYKYQNFCSPPAAALAFAQTITTRIKELSEDT